jgi:hypothetical protein
LAYFALLVAGDLAHALHQLRELTLRPEPARVVFTQLVLTPRAFERRRVGVTHAQKRRVELLNNVGHRSPHEVLAPETQKP